jgi:chromosome partitioning protein
MKIITLANNKGGCAKTTVTLNLAIGLAHQGARVLAIDLDSQGNLSAALGVNLLELAENRRTAYRFLLDESTDTAHYFLSSRPRLTLLPNCLDDQAETLLDNHDVTRELLLKERLLPLTNQFDYVLIDTPPRPGAPTLNALAVADLTIVPVDSSMFALIGLRELLRKIARIRNAHQPNMLVMALMSIYTQRQNLDKSIHEQVIKVFTADNVFHATIPRSVSVGESTSLLQSVIEIEPNSGSGFAYLKLLKELKEVLSNEEETIAAAGRQSR